MTGEKQLAAYWLEAGDEVLIELITPPQTGTDPRIRGTVTGATDAVLILTNRYGRTLRIPWRALALILDADAAQPHPAL